MPSRSDSDDETSGSVLLRSEQRRALRIALWIALFVALVTATVLFAVGEKGRPAPPQHDVLMYMQYARAIAEGHPYEYQAGDSPTTGSTSHLYPAVLAVFHKIGFHGENLLFASLLISLVCYLATIWLVGLLAAALLPHLMWLALALAIANGPLYLGVFGQTDMGLFTVCVLGVWTAAMYRRPLAALGALAAAVWTRPEGLLVSLGLLIGGALAAFRDRRMFGWCGVGLWGLVQFGLVLAWNHWLGESLAFHSVTVKGYWQGYAAGGALKRTLRDLAHMLIGIGFSAPHPRYAFRALYAFPLITGVMAVAGWIRLLKDESTAQRATACGWFLMIGGALATVAASGWQGFFFDRHVSWLFPFLILLAARGVNWMYEQRLRSPRTTRAPMLTLLLTGYAIVVFPALIAVLHGSAWTTAAQVRFARDKVSVCVPAGTKIGILNYPGLAYVLSGHKLVHLGGYISPRFTSSQSFVANLEILKHEPDQRFDFWLLSDIDPRPPTLHRLIGPAVAGEADVFPSEARLTLFYSDFSVLDGAGLPLSDDALARVTGLAQTDRLDVGYDTDERVHMYSLVDRDPKRRLDPGFAVATQWGRTVGDVGRVVLGVESFRMRAAAGKPARLVWRTGGLLTVHAKYDDREWPHQNIDLGTNRNWRVFVNGGLIGEGAATNEVVFEELAFDIPAERVTSEELHVHVEGDAVSFAWWLYQ